MKKLLALLLFAVAAPAAVTDFVVVGLSDGLMTACIDLGSTDDLRVFYDESPGTTFTPRQTSSTVTGGTRCIGVSNGFDPGDVINVRLQVNTGGGYGDVDCNSVTNDFTPSEQSTTGSVTCHASGYYVVTFETDNGMTPTAPTGYPSDLTLPDFSSGRQLTATTCDQINTHLDDLANDTPDGNADAILVDADISSACTGIIDLTAGKTNTDDIVIISDMYDDERCPEPGTTALYRYVDQCMPRLWRSAVGNTNGTLIDIKVSGIYLSLLHITTPDHTADVWGEGGAVDSFGDSGSDLALNFASANNFDASPNQLILTHCTTSSLNHVYYSGEWVDTDADTATLVGLAGQDASGCYAFQDPDGANSTAGALIDMENSAAEVFFDRVVIEQFYPDRREELVAAADTTDWWAANSTMIFGNMFALNSGGTAMTSGNKITGNDRAEQLFRLDNADRLKFVNNHIFGAGLWVYGTDAFRNQSNNWLVQRHFYQQPDERLDVEGSTADFDRVVNACRGHFIEVKNAVQLEIDGLLMNNHASCPGSDNAPSDVLQFRQAISSSSADGSKGSRDIKVQDVAIYNSPAGIIAEGQRWDQTGSVGSAEGRFQFDNILGNRLSEHNENGEDVSLIRGFLLNVVGNLNSVSLTRFTSFKNSVQGSTIQANNANVSKLQITDGVMAPENRAQGGRAFLRAENSTGQVPSSSHTSTEGAETFYNIARVTSGTNSYFTDLSFTCGLENGGTDFSVTSDAARMTDTECATEYNSTNYNMTSGVTDYTSAAGTSVQSDIDDMGLSDDLEYSATAGRGIDADEMRQGIGLFSPYTGRTYDIEVARNGNTGWTAYFRAPNTTDTCYAKYREYNTTGAYTTSTIASGARDRTWSVTGLTPGTRYEWVLQCGSVTLGGSPDALEGVWQPGS